MTNIVYFLGGPADGTKKKTERKPLADFWRVPVQAPHVSKPNDDPSFFSKPLAARYRLQLLDTDLYLAHFDAMEP